MALRIVLDTNVLVAALRSRRGASAELLERLLSQEFVPCISTALWLEYTAVCHRQALFTGHSTTQIAGFLRNLADVSVGVNVYFRLRPSVPDPKDELVLAAAVAGQCSHIVSYNVRDLRGAERYDVTVLTPAAFLELLEQANENSHD